MQIKLCFYNQILKILVNLTFLTYLKMLCNLLLVVAYHNPPHPMISNTLNGIPVRIVLSETLRFTFVLQNHAAFLNYNRHTLEIQHPLTVRLYLLNTVQPQIFLIIMPTQDTFLFQLLPVQVNIPVLSSVSRKPSEETFFIYSIHRRQ